MRLPTRRSERLKIHHDDGPLQLTQEGYDKLVRTLKRIKEKDLPESIEDVRRTAEFGDFSENAEYQEAKSRMRRLHAQIFGLKEKIKHATIIKTNATDTDTVQLGCTVVLDVGGEEKRFQLVGPHEADPTRGRISHVSPLGARLIGHHTGETIVFESTRGSTAYLIKSISV